MVTSMATLHFTIKPMMILLQLPWQDQPGRIWSTFISNYKMVSGRPLSLSSRKEVAHSFVSLGLSKQGIAG
jgi:hypothetical protein